MMRFIFEKLRKIFRSIGKLELRIIDKIILIDNLGIKKNRNLIINDGHFNKLSHELKFNKNLPKKMVIVICFYFNIKKLRVLSETLNNLSLYKFKKEINILTNNLSANQKKK